MSRKQSRSKYLSYILRHNPSQIGIQLDTNGWVDVFKLLSALQKQDEYFTLDVLRDIVVSDEKGRYSFSYDGTRIRANQGHSLKGIQMDFQEVTPPISLYHGTPLRNITSIRTKGLDKGNRHHVHLSADKYTAINVARRHSENIIILEVDTMSMIDDGIKFFISKNGIYLVDHVDPKYLKAIIEKDVYNNDRRKI